MRKFLYIALFAVALATSGCSNSVNRLLKEGDTEKIYAKAKEFYSREKWSRAIPLFESVSHDLSGTQREDSVAFMTARSYYKDRDYEQAAELLDEFRRKYSRSVFLEDAEGMFALCYYNLSPAPNKDQTLTRRAIVAISEFVFHYPNSDKRNEFIAMGEELNARLHEKAYLNAYTYYKIGQYKSALVAFKGALDEYPNTIRREEILYYIATSSYKLAANSIERLQIDRYISALDSYYTFVAEFPESKYRHEVDDMADNAKKFLEKRKNNNNNTQDGN